MLKRRNASSRGPCTHLLGIRAQTRTGLRICINRCSTDRRAAPAPYTTGGRQARQTTDRSAACGACVLHVRAGSAAAVQKINCALTSSSPSCILLQSGL